MKNRGEAKGLQDDSWRSLIEKANGNSKPYTHLVGVDPDIDKNGVCLYERSSRMIYLYNLTFFELFDFLKGLKQKIGCFKVVVEAGWYNGGNWHVKASDNARIVAKKGNSTGANHEAGRKIVEMCQYLGLDHQLIRPTKHKTDATAFAQLTGFKNRTNQEQRDACMLVYGM